MPSVANIIVKGKDDASDEINKVIRSVSKLDRATASVQGGGVTDLGRTLRGGAAATQQLTQATGGLQTSLRSVGGAAAGLAGVFGVAFGAQAVVGFGQAALGAANALEVTEARVKALAGSTERYDQIVNLARRGQEQYGGTLEENIAGLGALVNLSNRSGVAIETLDNAVRRLAAADPAQGIEGATVALREFLSGTGAEAVTSLAERFELPKAALTALADASVSTQQRMAGLDTALNDLGYTNEFLAASTGTPAASFDRLSSAWSNFAATLGSGISTALEPAAVATTDLLNRLTALGSIENLVTTATGERGKALQAALPQLLAAAAGTEAEEEAVRNLIGAYYAGTGAYADITTGTALFNAELAALVTGTEAASAAEYANTLAAHGMTTAHQDAALAAVAQRDALQQATEEAALNEAQNRLAAQANDELAANAQAAAEALLASGDASAAATAKMAAQYGVTIDLVNAYLQLASAANIARAAMDQMQAQEILTRQGKEPSRRDQSRTDLVKQQHAAAAAAQEAAEKAAKAAQAAAKKTGAAHKAAGTAAAKEAKAAAAAQAKAEREAAQAAAEAERAAEALQKAQDDLLSSEEKLAVYRERLAAGDLPEVERLRLMKEIRDLEEQIADEQDRARRAAIDAALAAIDDRKQRREEAKEIARAQRVLASTTTSEEQKAAARDVLERIPLEQAKRAEELADKLEDAGQAAPPTGAEYTTMPVPTPAHPIPVTIAQAALPPVALPAAALNQSFTLNATIVLPDGTTLGTGSVTTPWHDPITDLRLALRATGA